MLSMPKPSGSNLVVVPALVKVKVTSKAVPLLMLVLATVAATVGTELSDAAAVKSSTE